MAGSREDRQDAEQRVRAERARVIGLFRYQLIRQAADPAHSTKARGRLVRAGRRAGAHRPFGRRVRVSRQTVDRWIRDWRAGGFDALVPNPRQATPRTPAEVLELAVALRGENPQRTAAGIRRILRAQLGWSPDERTLQRHFVRLGLTGQTAAAAPVVFGRFEADRPNELWTGDALHGPVIAGRKTYLFAFLDDHSRAVAGHRWGYAEDTVRLATALRPALASRGVPESDLRRQRQRVRRRLAAAGLRQAGDQAGPLRTRPPARPGQDRTLVSGRPRAVPGRDHRRPRRRRPPPRGRSRGAEPAVTAWVETEYHRSVHSETGQPPLARWQAGGPFGLPTPATLAEAFLWEERRTVTKTAGAGTTRWTGSLRSVPRDHPREAPWASGRCRTSTESPLAADGRHGAGARVGHLRRERSRGLPRAAGRRQTQPVDQHSRTEFLTQTYSFAEFSTASVGG